VALRAIPHIQECRQVPTVAARVTIIDIVDSLDRIALVQELQLARDLSPHASSSWEESYAYERDEH
jgi:hypothetical protein